MDSHPAGQTPESSLRRRTITLDAVIALLVLVSVILVSARDSQAAEPRLANQVAGWAHTGGEMSRRDESWQPAVIMLFADDDHPRATEKRKSARPFFGATCFVSIEGGDSTPLGGMEA